MGDTLHWAVEFSALQMTFIVCIVGYVTWQRVFERHRKRIFDQLRPETEGRLMDLALSGGKWPGPVPKNGAERRVLEWCLGKALMGLKASGRERLASFAIEEDFDREWMRAAVKGDLNERKRALYLLGLAGRLQGSAVAEQALRDAHAEIRAEAARALLISAKREQVGGILRTILQESLLVRALLAGDLKRHAGGLMAMEGLESNRLVLLAAWGMAMTGVDMQRLLDAAGIDLSVELIALLPYAEVSEAVEVPLQRALAAEDAAIRCAAARASGQMKLTQVMPALVGLLKGDRQVATIAAQALGCLGVAGSEALQAAVTGDDRRAAAAAMEALESMTVDA